MPTTTFNNDDITNHGKEDPKSGWTGSVDIVNNNAGVLMGSRFTNITVPNGATITSATLTFSDGGSGAGNCGRIYGGAEDNFSAFGSSHRPSSGITKTTAFVQITAGTTNSYTVTSIVAEIIGRSGWASGNAIGFVGDGTSAAAAFDKLNNTGTPTPTLSITYTVPGGGGAMLQFCL